MVRRHQRRWKKHSKRRYTTRQKEAYARKLRKRMTPAEQKVWQLLKQEQWKVGAEWKPQVIVCGYIPDFAEINWMMLTEIDGPVHRHLKKRDAERQKHLEEAGYQVMRFTNKEALDRTSWVVDKMLYAGFYHR